VEEPTSPDDIRGHARIRAEIAPIRVATGEAVQNRIVFKQLLQAEAIDVVQIDATRVAGVNENMANLLLAAKFGIPVCPHAGGVGLCELVQHYSFFDYAVVSRSQDNRMIEYVDHLHEHFVAPVQLRHGRYLAPAVPGIGAEILPESVNRWSYPDGDGWVELR
jgi:L-fuconate dehydratase